MTEKKEVRIPNDILKKWQRIVNLTSTLLDVPAALIMRLEKKDLEVLVASSNQKNPYRAGEKTPFYNSGLYCEKTIGDQDLLMVENARDTEKWNGQFKPPHGMVSYLGIPILFPDNRPFGTICIQDNKKNRFSSSHIDLMKNLRDIIQANLELIHMNAELSEKNKTVSQFIEEIKMLRGIVPICSNCKKIRDSSGNWETVETFIEERADVSFSHSLCQPCADQLYGHKEWYKEMKTEENG